MALFGLQAQSNGVAGGFESGLREEPLGGEWRVDDSPTLQFGDPDGVPE